MTRWEYRVAQRIGEGDDSTILDALGLDGWELVTVVRFEEYARNHYRFYFKRPLTD